MIRSILLALVRHLLTAAGGALAAQGYLNENEIHTATGAALALVMVAWSAWSKRPKPALPPNPLPAIPSEGETADDLNRTEALLLRQQRSQ